MVNAVLPVLFQYGAVVNYMYNQYEVDLMLIIVLFDYSTIIVKGVNLHYRKVINAEINAHTNT